jgi:hypothetical protein
MSDSASATVEVQADPPADATARSQPTPVPSTGSKPKRQPRYHVVLWNDDDHTYEYVIAMLRRLFGIEPCTFLSPPRTHAAHQSVFARVAFPDCTARPAAPPTMAPRVRVGSSARGGTPCWLGCVDYVYFAAPLTRPCT